MLRTLALLAFALPFAACASGPELPAGEGRGLIAADPSPPPGAQTYDRPTWQVGDRFVLVSGAAARGQFEVIAADANGYVVVSDSGLRQKLDANLGVLGEWNDKDEPRHLMTPVDVSFHWPLWVGKRWRCAYADRTYGGASLPFEVTYVVEDLDSVTTPAGTFQALRLARTVHFVTDTGRYLDRTRLLWYAPAIGMEVRRLSEGVMTELVERTRK